MYGCDSHIGCLKGSVTRIGEGLKGSVTRIGEGLKGRVSYVCTTNRDSYLRISPDVVWLTPEMLSGEFDIYSNVVWKIE